MQLQCAETEKKRRANKECAMEDVMPAFVDGRRGAGFLAARESLQDGDAQERHSSDAKDSRKRRKKAADKRVQRASGSAAHRRRCRRKLGGAGHIQQTKKLVWIATVRSVNELICRASCVRK